MVPKLQKFQWTFSARAAFLRVCPQLAPGALAARWPDSQTITVNPTPQTTTYHQTASAKSTAALDHAIEVGFSKRLLMQGTRLIPRPTTQANRDQAEFPSRDHSPMTARGIPRCGNFASNACA